jgi:hypothetical protein
MPTRLGASRINDAERVKRQQGEGDDEAQNEKADDHPKDGRRKSEVETGCRAHNPDR